MNKIIHGDCLEELKKIENDSIDLIVTDPPYGIDFQSARRTDKAQWKPKIANDKKPYIWWILEAYRVLKPNSALLCFTRFDTEKDFRWALELAGFETKQQIIWDKVIHGMGDLKGDYASQHENIIFATKGRFIFPGKRPKSIIRTQRVTADKLVHPNEKPVELMVELIKACSKEGDTILDPFAGSCPVAMACKELNRNYVMIEREQNYVGICNDRLIWNAHH